MCEFGCSRVLGELLIDVTCYLCVIKPHLEPETLLNSPLLLQLLSESGFMVQDATSVYYRAIQWN
jgi:hypothetical protein